MAKIEDVKQELKTHKELLDYAFEKNNYASIVEESEKVTKLSYLLLVNNLE